MLSGRKRIADFGVPGRQSQRSTMGSECGERGWRIVIGDQVRLMLGGVAQARRFGP